MEALYELFRFNKYTKENEKHKKSYLKLLDYSLDINFSRYNDYYFDSLNKLKEEIKYQRIIEEKTGYNVYINPKAKNKSVKTPDYYITPINELWDIKEINGNSPSIIDNIFHKGEKQANNLILVMKNTNFNSIEIKHKILDFYTHNKRLKIKQVVLLDKQDKIILYLKR